MVCLGKIFDDIWNSNYSFQVFNEKHGRLPSFILETYHYYLY